VHFTAHLGGPTSMKGVERTNAVIVHPNQWTGFMQWQNLYAIDVDRERNC